MMSASFEAAEEEVDEDDEDAPPRPPVDDTLEQVPLKMLEASVEVKEPLEVVVVVSK